MNAAVRQMDRMTQHNAALVEETNAAIRQTEAQASELDHIVDIFRLGEQGSRAERDQSTVADQTKIYRRDGGAAVDVEWMEQ